MPIKASSRQVIAREQARERAATYAARERELVELAESFFLADGEAEDVLASADARIAAIREQAERDVTATRAKAAQVVEQMLATGTPIAQVADRLGLNVAELRRVRGAASSVVVGDGAGAGGDAEGDDAAAAAAAAEVDVDVQAPQTEAEQRATVRRSAA